MKKQVFILLTTLLFWAVLTAQEGKKMYIMKGGKVIHEIAVSDIDSIVFNNSIIDDPKMLILGKWELVEIHFYNPKPYQLGDGDPYQPTGYFEFLPDSLVAWYDYATQKYTLLEIKYWFEDIGQPINPYFQQSIMWGLHFNHELEIAYPLPNFVQDGWGLSLYDCTFFSKDCIGLYQMVDFSLVPSPTYIYKRKK